MVEMEGQKGWQFVPDHPATEPALEPGSVLSQGGMSRSRFQGETDLEIQQSLTETHISFTSHPYHQPLGKMSLVTKHERGQLTSGAVILDTD